MKITIYGAGYVGLVTGICFAELGNEVICMDIDAHKISQLQKGQLPIYEPGLEILFSKNQKAQRISFTTNLSEAVQHGFFQFIAVGTPSDKNGAADMQYVMSVAKAIGEHIENESIIITKSTVPVGTANKVKTIIASELHRRQKNISFNVASNPEFLKEGSAVSDFMKPDRIIVGSDNSEVIAKIRSLYAPLMNNKSIPFISMDIASSELTKYAANAFLATKISFMNEMSQIAERVGADIELVRQGIGTDPRIGMQFLLAGCGYGGSCFPKDVRAIKKLAEEVGVTPYMITAAESVNIRQKKILINKLNHYFKQELKGKTIAVWGLSFKPNTDDMREASSCVLMEALWEKGARVQAYDPVAMKEAQHIYGSRHDLKLCQYPEEALENADVLAILTEWQEFYKADLQLIKQKLRYPVIFDGRNIYDPLKLADYGLDYYGVGRGLKIDF